MYTVADLTSTHQPFKNSRDAIAFAATVAKQSADRDDEPRNHSREGWSRPFHAVVCVRYYPETGETLVHRYDRYGREQGGTPYTADA